ncbi:MAG: hypothetical protein IJZ86_07660 [Bacteroides sp.]|nr:hypothetical protein [Bacteroides sp.]
MKQFVKILWMAILLLLLHRGAAEATDVFSVPTQERSTTEVCTRLQAPPTASELLQLAYQHIASQSLCLKVTDTLQVPGNKMVRLLPVGYHALHSFNETQSNTHISHLQPTYYDPLGYYVYGLRKILI